jgi:transcriptional regulator with XRE-family HTH domain
VRKESVGARLRRLRLERGLSQRELASPGVSYAYISRIEAGTRQPSVKALRRLATKLEVSVPYLETGSDLDSTDELELSLADLELSVRLGEGTGLAPALQSLLQDAVTAGDRECARRARVALARVADAPEERIALLEEAVEDEPFSPLAWPGLYTELGIAYAAAGRPRLAVALFERCLEACREEEHAGTLEAHYRALAARPDGRGRTQEEPHERVRLHRSLALRARAAGRATHALAEARKAVALLEATDALAS